MAFNHSCNSSQGNNTYLPGFLWDHHRLHYFLVKQRNGILVMYLMGLVFLHVQLCSHFWEPPCCGRKDVWCPTWGDQRPFFPGVTEPRHLVPHSAFGIEHSSATDPGDCEELTCTSEWFSSRQWGRSQCHPGHTDSWSTLAPWKGQ